MRLPELYASVDRARALQELFPSARPLGTASPGEPQWWGTDDALVCFTTVGRWHRGKLGHSYFSSSRRFNSVPAVVQRGASVGDHPSIPKEIRARETGGRREEVFCAQNHLLGFEDPYRVTREGEKLVWSRMNEAGAQWIQESVPLSIALIQACIFEASMLILRMNSVGAPDFLQDL